MRSAITLVLILSIITSGYSDPKKPKKPKGCTPYNCSDWDWNNKKGLFDPHSIRWPLHYNGHIYKDKVDGGHYDIDVVFNHYGKKTRVPLKKYRNSTYHPDPWFLDKGLKMNDPIYCDYWVEDKPYWQPGNCSLVGATFEEVVVNFGGPSCSKIIRNWVVVDWCKYVPNGVSNTKTEKYSLVKDLASHSVYFAYGSGHYDIEHDGWYTFQQEIKVLDKDPPKLLWCSDVEIDLEGECHTKVKLKNRAVDTGKCPGEKLRVELEVYKEDGTHVHSDWIDAWHDKDFDVHLGYLSGGTYLVHWNVTDGCQNVGKCIQKIKVIDKNPPHLICIEDLSASISGPEGITIWAKDFVHKVQGPCYDDNLTYSFAKDSIVTSMTFVCPDGPGLNEMEVFVTASNGISASCNVSLFVSDHAECNPDAMQIAGKVTDKFKRPIAGAEVFIEAASIFVNSGMTNENGIYSIGGISFDLGRPVLSAKVDDQSKKGLDAVDLILVLRHALDIEKLKYSDQRAAADVNSDGKIDIEDYWDLTDIIYDVPGREASIEEWKFYDEKTGLFAGFSHMRLVEPVKLARYRHEYGLIGLKTGDVDFSWSPEEKAGSRSAAEISTFKNDVSGDLYQIHIEVPRKGEILNFILDAAGINSEDILSVSSQEGALDFVVHEMNGQNALIIMSRKNIAGENITILSRSLDGISNKGILIESFSDGSNNQLDWILKEQKSGNELAAYPNPFNNLFTLEINAEKGETATLEIFDATGRLLNSQIWSLQSGTNKKQLDGSLFREGLHIAAVTTSQGSYVRRIIKN